MPETAGVDLGDVDFGDEPDTLEGARAALDAAFEVLNKVTRERAEQPSEAPAYTPLPEPKERGLSPEEASELLDMTLYEAAEKSWANGRTKYGVDWAGDHPLLECLEECADARNYLLEAARKGDLKDTELAKGLQYVRALWALCSRNYREAMGMDKKEGSE